MIDSLFQDVRYTIRTLRASPGFALGVILTLALGIGANSTIFGVINAALLRPLPYPDADRIVSISTTSATSDFNVADEPSIARWIESARGFDAIAAYRAHGGNWTDGSTAEYLRGAEVTSRFFGAMGVAPAIGRGFTDAESRGDAGRVVILGNGIWRRALGGDHDVLGRNVRIDGLDFTVIGIMSRGFEFPRGAQYWTPLTLDSTADSDGTAFYSFAIGRLAPGVSYDAGRAELEAIRRRADGLPASFRELGARVIPLQERLHGDLRPTLLVLLGVVGCVLLIACANVANLLLARATVRRRELAFRVALGASRGRIVRQLLVESAVLALAGGALGLLIPIYGLDLVAALGPAALTRVPEIGVDGTVLGFTLGVSLLTGILFGLAPAVAASGADVQHALKEGSGAVGGGRGLSRRALVTAELALAVLLLVGAGLFIRSFLAFRAVDPGFRAEGVLTAQFVLPRTTYPDEPSSRAFSDALLSRVRALPGVDAATITRIGPLGGYNATSPFTAPGRESADPEDAPQVAFGYVGADYFTTFGIPLLAGRDFTSADRVGAPPVAIVSESMARLAFPDGPAIGRSLAVRDGTYTVVGVAAEARQRPGSVRNRPIVYLAERQQAGALWFGILALHSRSDPTSHLPAIRDIVRDLDAELALHGITTMERELAASRAPRRFQALLVGTFAALALILAASGLYALIAYLVARRTREIGVRVALGARRGDVVRLVLEDGALPVAFGVGLGLAGAFALTRLIESQLFGVASTDPVTFVLVPVGLAIVALAASWLPARQAARVDPMTALRQE